MTERKPPGQSWESWIDQQIREAREAGEFDNLPGAGKPLPDLNADYDPLCRHLRPLDALEFASLGVPRGHVAGGVSSVGYAG